jgi:L-amino acid N-acyltransferase YncA
MSAIIDDLVYQDLGFEGINQSIIELEKLIFSLDGADKCITDAFHREVSPEKRAFLIDCYCDWETTLEASYANQILADEVTSAGDYLLYDRFCHLINKELALIGHHFERLLFIGSGPFPITAILLHQFTGKRIDCLERNAESAALSSRVLQKLGLASDVIIHEGEGGSFDLAPYDVVLNALLAKPKRQIMKNIFDRTRPDCKVLCRTSSGLRELLYEATAPEAIRGFCIEDQQTASYDDMISTWLLSKQKAAPAGVNLHWIGGLDAPCRARLQRMMNKMIAGNNMNGFLAPVEGESFYFQQLQMELKHGLKHLMVLERDGQYLGQLVITRYLQDTYAHRAEVCSLMLDKTIRGREVSLQIAQALLEKCNELNLRYLTLDVRAGSNVESLWKHLGFVPYGKLPCYSVAGGTEYEGVFMFQEVSRLEDLLLKGLKAIFPRPHDR